MAFAIHGKAAADVKGAEKTLEISAHANEGQAANFRITIARPLRDAC
ncbi:hypothetical protein FHS31_000307 [Sphingomonas vulcanisoli]|uniref:Uncharacterized protein n=1 Tax=Sphingomonas vulcanisoli TaxID=1658060 RepID=A0ABX0TQ38_9SPHN|nr:hypothetical protein [Sphingomonas vulcanisoli]NIJ06725.1 hypothetical protein [Sphingomonas vulcanisoli]